MVSDVAVPLHLQCPITGLMCLNCGMACQWSGECGRPPHSLSWGNVVLFLCGGDGAAQGEPRGGMVITIYLPEDQAQTLAQVEETLMRTLKGFFKVQSVGPVENGSRKVEVEIHE